MSFYDRLNNGLRNALIRQLIANPIFDWFNFNFIVGGGFWFYRERIKRVIL